MERLIAPRSLHAQLAISACILLLALFALQVTIGGYALQLMQDRSKQQILRPFAIEVAELLDRQQRGSLSFEQMQETLFHRFHGVSELGIFVFSVEGRLLNVLSFSGVSSDLSTTAGRIDVDRTRSKIERYLDQRSQPLFPLYIDDPQNPERQTAFAAAPLSQLKGFVVVTPGGELSRVLSSIGWDATGVATAIAALILSILGAGLLGFILFRRTSSRFRELSRVITRMAGGDLNYRAPVDGSLADKGDELASLLRAINHLGDALQRRQRERQLILSAVAHDLHSPIAVIAGHSELLLANQSPERISVFSSIRKSALSASGMVSELLELAVLDAQGEDHAAKPFDIADLLDEMVFGLQGRATQAGVTLSASFPDHSTRTLADPLQIERVISNLVGNAIRHTPSAGIVEIGVRPRGSALEVYVRDSGEGIPPDQLDSIMQPYSQGEHRAQRAKGLAGLGLTICREILARHGSVLRIESTVGVGTTCSFLLPSHPASEAAN